MGAPGVPKMGYFDGRVPKLNVNVNVTLVTSGAGVVCHIIKREVIHTDKQTDLLSF